MSENSGHIKWDLFIIYFIFFIIYQLLIFYLKEILIFDIITYFILFIIIILPLIPHIDEVKIGFFSLKTKLDEFKQDIDKKLLLLQNVVVTSVSQKQQIIIYADK